MIHGDPQDVARQLPTINVFLLTANDTTARRANPCRDGLRAFADGLARSGVAFSLVSEPIYEPCDIAVIYGAWSPDTMSETRAFRNAVISAHPGDIVMLETPFFGRTVQQRPPWERWLRKKLFGKKPHPVLDSFGYFRVGVNGTLHDTADFNNRAVDGERWCELQRRFGIRLRPYRRDGRHILVMGQVPSDASLRGADMLAWMRATVDELRRQSRRPIVVRPHPASSQADLKAFAEGFQEDGQVKLDFPPRGTLATVLRDCWAVVAYSSSGTVDALLRGIPAIAMDPGNIAWPVTDHDLTAIDRPTLHDREPWLHQLAYTQWSFEELRQGAAWNHLRPVLAISRRLAA